MTTIEIHKQDSAGFWTAIATAAAAVAGAVVAGFWQWLGNRKKQNAEAVKVSMDAQASVMNGFILLLEQFKDERVVLASRISELEQTNLKLDRRVMQLERHLVVNGVEIPHEPI